MIYRHLQLHYGPAVAEEILLEAMTLLGRLPHSQFMFHERDTCPKVSCPNSTVWFSYLSEEGTDLEDLHSIEENHNFTIELHNADYSECEIFHCSILEIIARAIERHERKMKSSQINSFALDQMDIDFGIKRVKSRLS